MISVMVVTINDCCELQVVGGWNNGDDIQTRKMTLSHDSYDDKK
jgi:hypothetical protein